MHRRIQLSVCLTSSHAERHIQGRTDIYKQTEECNHNAYHISFNTSSASHSQEIKKTVGTTLHTISNIHVNTVNKDSSSFNKITR